MGIIRSGILLGLRHFLRRYSHSLSLSKSGFLPLARSFGFCPLGNCTTAAFVLLHLVFGLTLRTFFSKCCEFGLLFFFGDQDKDGGGQKGSQKDTTEAAIAVGDGVSFSSPPRVVFVV